MEKLKYIIPSIEIVQDSPFELCAASKTADYEGKDQNGGSGTIVVDPDDAARFTWGNLWDDEEEYTYSYSQAW